MKRQLCEERYSTIHNLIKFYDDYKQKCPEDFQKFFLEYQPGLIYGNFSCTGLALDLFNRISSSKLSILIPNIIKSLYLLSSEEIISDVDLYCSHDPPEVMGVEKEHVLLGLKISIDGRIGYMLLDPGYHIRCPIVVMEDGKFPQSTTGNEFDENGWYLQNITSKCKKDYKYIMHGSNKYIKWIVKETRGENRKLMYNLIHCGNAFMSPLDIVERRNLVFDFKNVIARNENGIFAGVYFVMKKESHFTLFYPLHGMRNETKIPFMYFSETKKNEGYEDAMQQCEVKTGYKCNELRELLSKVVTISEDVFFMARSMDIDEKINNSSSY